MAGNNIKVVCRFRPQNSLEIREGGVPIIEIDEEGTSVELKGNDFKGPPFAFDKIFGMASKQKEVFDYSIKSIVDDVVNGYNGTVFAYGQTGSGKTFTMMGADIGDDSLKGITPRLVEQIFQNILDSPSNMEFTVKVSYMEIYMEKIRDLLNPANDNLPIHEDKTRGVYVKGLFEVYVSSVQEIHEVMTRGGAARMVAYTNMNAESSRSHSIFVITVANKNLDTGAVRQGKLHLVDLAGSEKVGKTGASGQTLEEAKKINKSLTALGMVINALTDGKSSHVPYRDSKLTRILQEALGGNSRTTLIINCSPSSYNEAETLGTLRFGMRAKSIKNKAKVNADLSPAELKALLKKVKSEAVTFQAYISALEGEVSIWRSGQTVPEAQWATIEKANKTDGPASPTSAVQPSTPQPAFKALLMDESRPPTPGIVLEKDEREEFLKRENELMDQIAEKESELTNRETHINQLKEECGFFKEQEDQVVKENQQMTAELNELRLQLQKASYEGKENAITVDTLKDTNQELNSELDELKKQLMELRVAQKETADGEKERKKAEKMAAMMANFDPSNEISEKEKQIRDALAKLDSESLASISADEVASLRQELAGSRTLIEQHERNISELVHVKETLERKREDLEGRLTNLEVEYEELLDKTIAEEEKEEDTTVSMAETVAELKSKLEMSFAAKKEIQQKEIDELKIELEHKTDEYHKLSSAMTELKRTNEQLQVTLNSQPKTTADMTEKEKDMERTRKSMAQQLVDFESMKKSLMRDLQNRCEKVVELEISLDETREQYNNVLRASNNKQQQKKMAFLERNLEQLTNVQKQLVEQNSFLKKEVAVAERKLTARNERIQSLETLLMEAQEQLITTNQKFDVQLQAVRNRLEQARSQKTLNAAAALNFGRIVKPLRGGSTVPDDAPQDKRASSSWMPFLGAR